MYDNHTPHLTTSRRRRRQRSREAFTIVELMIVMTIIGLIAGGAAFVLLPQMERAKVKQARADANAIGSAATLWMIDNDGCPTVSDLIDDGILDQNKATQDPWDNDFQIDCGEGDPRVTSAGPDEQMGTEDDID